MKLNKLSGSMLERTLQSREGGIGRRIVSYDAMIDYLRVREEL